MKKEKRSIAALLAAVALLVLSNVAGAIPIQVTAGGVFTQQGSPLVADGAQWSLNLVYESSALDLTPNLATEGLYAAYLSLEIAIGDQLYSLSDLEASRTNVQIFNDRVSAGGQLYRDVLRFRGGIVGSTLNFDLITSFGYEQPGGGPLSSDALISDPALLTSLFDSGQDPGWQFTNLIFFDLPPGQRFASDSVDGTVDQFSASAQPRAVPEPGALELLSLGLLLVVLSSVSGRMLPIAAAPTRR